MRSFHQKLWLFFGWALVFLSSCGEGRVAGMGAPEESPPEGIVEQGGEGGAPEDGMRVKGMPVVSSKAKEVVFWRSTSEFPSKAEPDAHGLTVVTFNPLPESALRELQEENRRNSGKDFGTQTTRIGVHRKADEAGMSNAQPLVSNWQDIGNGVVARLALSSPDARRMRVALQLHALPDNAELRFAGSAEPQRVIGVVRGKEAKALRSETKVYWTPSTEGETQNIEIYLPSLEETKAVEIRLEGVSHIFTSAKDYLDADRYAKSILVIGNAGPCHVDVVCRFNALGIAFQNTSNAVARIEYEVPRGTTHCSGTLLNDSVNSGTPYFWSAAHCINTQARANTVETFWFEEASRCGDNTSVELGNIQRVGGGAQLLHARRDTDTLLLRLNDFPPAGAFFSGWDSTRFLNGAAIGIHHPNRDIKKVSFGEANGTCDAVRGAGAVLDNTTLTLVSWAEGTTEGGSSGSGLFTLSGDGNYYWRGGLQGGFAECSNEGGSVASGNYDCYSSLNVVWNDVRQWLAPAPVLSNGSVTNITATSADFRITSDQNATAYWLVLPANAPAPSAAQVIAWAGTNTGAMTANAAFARTLSGLSSRTAYRLHFVASNNHVPSAVWSQAFTTPPLPIVDVPTGVDGRILTPAQTGDTVHWVEIARNGNYALIVRSQFVNVHPNRVVSGQTVWGDPAWQHTSFGSSTHYMTAQNSIRWKINDWFNGTAPGEAESLPVNARLRNFTAQSNAGQVLGSSTWSPALNDGFSRPTHVLVGTGNDVAFALSYGEAANFVSLLHFLRGMYIANQPSSDIAVANYAKISIPTSFAYYGMWLRSPGDLPQTAAFLSSSFSQVVPGRVFQSYINTSDVRGLLYPALWVDEYIFSP